MLAEFVGTFLLMYFGDGAVAVSVAAGAYNLWAVSLMWFLAVAFAIYAAGAVSGAHINPAVTITMATYTDFPWSRVIPYIVAQLLGAFFAAVLIHIQFGGIIAGFEAANGIVRGAPGSQLSAMIYTTYAPNPAIVGTTAEAFAKVSHLRWFLSELFITAVLLFGIFFLTDERNPGLPRGYAAVMIGLLVAGLVAYEAPVSMAALNPARDLGPRFFAFLAGWGGIAFPGPRGGWWIPTVSTIVGGLVGGFLYHYVYKGVFASAGETA